MPVIVHVFDESVGWEKFVAISQLLDRLPSDRFSQSLAAIEPVPDSLRRRLDRSITLCAVRMGLTFTAAPALRRLLESRHAEVVHAWGVRSAIAAAAAGAKILAVGLFDPEEAIRGVKPLRTLARSRNFAVVCNCEIVRRRLVEGGLAPEATVLIRPGVDFARINATRRGGLRESLGLLQDQHAVLLNTPARRDGGQFDAVLAVSLLSHFQRRLALILPTGPRLRGTNASGAQREGDRILRFVRTMLQRPHLVVPPDSVPYEELVAAADTLVVAPRGDAPTTAIAWAMGARTAVLGSAVPCVAEFIAHKVNGRLFKQTPGKGMATTIARLLRDRSSYASLAEAAHGQAYEVFSVRRYVDQHARLYENLRNGIAPTEGIVDSSRVA